MKKIIFLTLLLFARISLSAQTYRLDTFYNFKHHAIWNTLYAVNNDLDTCTGWSADKTVLKIKKTEVTWKVPWLKKTFHYRIDSVEYVIPNVYTIYHTWNKEFNIECTFIITVNKDRTFVYDVWEKTYWIKQGWISTIPNKKKSVNN